MTPPLSFDHLQAILRQHTAGLPDVRKPSPNTRYTIQNAALGAFGIFFMQSPSFLEYQRQLHQRQGHDNAQTLFGVEPIPQRVPRRCATSRGDAGLRVRLRLRRWWRERGRG